MGNPEMFSILTNEAGIVSPRVNRSLNSSCVSRLMGYTGNVIYIFGQRESITRWIRKFL